MASHQISIRPDYRGHGRVTFGYRCSCGSYSFGSQSRGAAEQAGRAHQKKAGAR